MGLWDNLKRAALERAVEHKAEKEGQALAHMRRGVDEWLPKVETLAEIFGTAIDTAKHYDDGTPFGSAVRAELRRLVPAVKALVLVFESFVAAFDPPPQPEPAPQPEPQPKRKSSRLLN